MLVESSTGSLLFPLFLLLYGANPYLCQVVLLFITFPSDESEEEERAKSATKEEEDVDVLHSWMEVGGHPACPEEEAKGLLAEVNAFPCFFPIPPPSLDLLFATDSSLTILILDCYFGYFLLLFRV